MQLTDELRAAVFSAARSAYLRWSTRTVKERDDALRCAVNAALFEAMPVLVEAGAELERKRIAAHAQKLNYGPTLRAFIKQITRGQHAEEK